MEHPFILPYINQRMRELGFEDFHYESVRITVKDSEEPVDEINYDQFTYTPFGRPKQFVANKFQIQAENQYYFLVEKTVDPTLKIYADNDCLTAEEAANYTNYTFFNFKEFTGQIFLETAVDAINLEFIKCTPYNNNK